MSLKAVVEKIKREQGLQEEVPGFDPKNGNEQAKYLFLLEAPGPKAVQTGYISFDNPDPSARNFRQLLDAAGIHRSEIAIWNTVPWYIGNEEKTRIRAAQGYDIRGSLEYLADIIAEIPGLEYIVLMGSASRKAHVFLSKTTSAKIVSCHHTSNRVKNVNPHSFEENLEVLRFISQG
jgi:uracil-DNA glycosylase